MSKKNNSDNLKPFGSKNHQKGLLNLPGVNPAITSTLEDYIKDLSEGLSKALASFYVGDYSLGKDAELLGKTAAQKNNHRSILGNDSIYSQIKGISSLIQSIRDIMKNSLNDKNVKSSQGKSSENVVKLIIEGLDYNNLDSLKNLEDLKFENFNNNAVNIREFLKAIKELSDIDPGIDIDKLKATYHSIDDLFNIIISIGNSSQQVNAANQQVLNTLSDVEETAIKTSKKTKDIKQSVINMNGLNDFMIAAAATMTIGALFVMIGGGKFVKSALLFGVALGVFEALVIAPIILFSKYKIEVFKGIEDLNTFIFTCTTVLLIGALFVMLGGGKYVEAAFMFGITLAIFETLVVAPFLLFEKDQARLFEGLKNFSAFLFVCTTVMLVGALFMQLSGGKLVTNALAFGFVLMMFESLVVAPFILFNKLSGDIDSGLTHFSAVLIVCTTVLLIGALFMEMGGGKFVKAAIEFTGVLMLFEAGVIAPFLLFNFIKPAALSGIKDFTSFLIVTTACLLVGALFMTMRDGKMPKAAIEFTGILSGFILGIIYATKPLKKFLTSDTKDKLEEFSVFILVCTACLTVGSLFVNKYGSKPAALYATILSAFVFAIGKIAQDIVKTFDKKTLDSLIPFSLFLGTLHLILITGMAFIQKYGTKGILKYPTVISLFVKGMGWVSDDIAKEFDNKKLDSLLPFSIFVGTLHLILLTGTRFIQKYGANGIIAYGSRISGFIYLMLPAIAAVTAIKTIGSIAILKNSIGITNPLQLLTGATKGGGLYSFVAFVGVMHIIILTGSKFVQKYGSKVVAEYALILSSFVYATVGAYKWLSKNIENVTNGAKTMIILAGSMAVFAGVLSLINFLFPNEAAGLLILVKVGILALIMEGFAKLYNQIASLNQKRIEQASIIIGEISLSLGLFAGVIKLIDMMFPNEAEGLLIVAKVGVLALMIKGLTWFYDHFRQKNKHALNEKIVRNAAIIIGEISLSLGLFAGVIKLIDMMFPDNSIQGGVESAILLVKVAAMGALALGLGYFYKNLGKAIDLKEVGKTTLLIGAISLSLGLFGTVIYYLNTLFTEISFEALLENIGAKLCGSVFALGVFFTALGALLFGPQAALFAIGAGAVLSMSVSLGAYGLVIEMIDNIMNEHGSTINDNLKKLTDTVTGDNSLITLFTKISSITMIAADAAITMIPIKFAVFGLASVIQDIVKAVRSLEDIDLAEGIETISTNINKFFEIPNKVSIFGDGKGEGPLGQLISGLGLGFVNQAFTGYKIFMKLGMMMAISKQISYVISSVANGVYSMAKLQIPYAWDKDGKPIRYRQLMDTDFDLAGENVGKILNTLTKALIKVWEGDNGSDGIKKLLGGSTLSANIMSLLGVQSPLGYVLDYSMKVSQLIGSIGENISFMAKYQIATRWDENGKPIRFRTLKEKDFDEASRGIKKILTTVFSALIGIYYGDIPGVDSNIKESIKQMFNEKEGFIGIGAKKAPINQVLEASFKVSELVGNIGEGVANIAKLQIPIKWDEHGKVVKYRTLTPTDFTNMGIGLSSILTSIFTELGKLYYKDIGDGQKLGDLFDGGSNGFFGLGKSDSKITKVLNASLIVSQLIGNMASGIKDIAVLQIPKRWNDEGKPIEWEKIDSTDFVTAGINIGTIITTIIDSLSTYINDEKFNPDRVKKVLDAISPVNDIVAGMAEAVVNLGQAMVPTRWDPKTGKPIWYRKMTSEDFAGAALTIGGLVIGISQALIDTFNNPIYDKYLFKNGKPSGKLSEVVQSISGVTDIISNTADAMVKLGQARIPVYKNGKIVKYEKINFNTVTKNLKEVITELITGISTTLIDVVQDNPDLFKGGEDSLFGSAVNSISGVTKIVTDIVDSVVKLGQAQVPDYKAPWKDGKPTKYKQFNPKDTIDSINSIIPQILISAGSSLFIAYTYLKFLFDHNVDETIGTIEDINNKILNIINKSSKTLIEIATMNIPSKIDKDGKPIGYVKFDDTKITAAGTTIQKIIAGLFNAFDNEEINKKLSRENINQFATNIKRTETISVLIETAMYSIFTNINQITDNIESLRKVLNYKSSTEKINNETIGLFNDLQVIIKAIDSFINTDLFTNINLTTANVQNEDIEKKKEIIIGKISSITSLFDSISDHLVDIFEIYNKIYSIKNIKIILNNTPNENTFANNFENIILSINTISDKLITNKINKFEIDSDQLISLANINTYIKNIVDNIVTLVSIVSRAKINFQNTDKTINRILSYYLFVSNAIDKYSFLFTKSNSIESINMMNETIYSMVNVINEIGELEYEYFVKGEMLNYSIQEIYKNITSQRSESNTFKANTENLQKYIKAVNSINLRKSSSLTQLVQELNELAKRMGNLDNLTTAISDKLSSVLNELVERLEESKETIEKADEIQVRRHAMIKNSVEKIQYLMGQPLNITVETKKSDDEDPNNTSNEDPTKKTTTTPPPTNDDVDLAGGIPSLKKENNKKSSNARNKTRK